MKTNPKICARIFRAALILIAYPLSTALGYGPEGHKTVGAIADNLIKNSPNTVAHVRALIGTDTLEKTATWADECKAANLHDPEMIAFTTANHHTAQSDGPHDHFAYHYTDIPIQEAHYRAGSVGAKPIDVVRMVRNCIAILEGHSNATNNPTSITQKTALRLLVHYVGDIHQPLHVGAAYFGPNAQLVNPNTTGNGQADQGGNFILFGNSKLHSYWDTPAVHNAMTAAHAQSPRGFAQKIIANPPQGWDSGSFMSGWSVKWADEMLPIAKEAHTRLTFTANAKSWTAHSNDLAAYDQWAAGQVRAEIGRAGYRLAAILKKIWP
jgi:S1/P1 Nuclease